MELVLVRHGQTEMNVLNAVEDFRLCGAFDTSLTAKGIEQAKALRNNKLLTNLDEIYSSSLSRAYETAKYALPGREHEIIVSDLLRERSLGIFDGKCIQYLKRHPEYSKFFTDKSLMPFRQGSGPRAPGGQNNIDVVRRIEKICSTLDFNSNKKIGFFFHIQAMRCTFKVLFGLTDEQIRCLKIPNCTPIVINYNKEKAVFELVTPTWDVLFEGKKAS